jgi:flavin-dependent dehydrogenase
MNMNRFDAVVVGAGPAGSIAALTLARGGARVALIVKARFPRDKACGDLIGPRGVGLLSELGVRVEATRTVRDLPVIGPGGHEIRMWCQTTGEAYPDYASYVRRTALDNALFNEAVRAGAVPIHGRVGDPIRHDCGRLIGVSHDSGRAVGAEFFIGADGSTSRLGQIANLVDPACGLWCFAIRTYRRSSLDTPHIILRDEKPWKAFPGYGWIFPDGTGWANVGVGIGVGPNRSRGSRATFGRHEAPAAAIQTKTLRHLRMASAAGRMLTRWPLADVLGEPSAIYLGQLSDGAVPGGSLHAAKMIESFTNMITSRSKIRRDIEASFAGPFANEPAGQTEHLGDRLAA